MRAILVAPARALMTRTLPRRDFIKASRVIRSGQQVAPEALQRAWVEIVFMCGPLFGSLCCDVRTVGNGPRHRERIATDCSIGGANCRAGFVARGRASTVHSAPLPFRRTLLHFMPDFHSV